MKSLAIRVLGLTLTGLSAVSVWAQIEPGASATAEAAAVREPAVAPVGWVDLDGAPEWCLALPAAARPIRGRVLWLDVPEIGKLLDTAPLSLVDEQAGRLVGPTVATSQAIITLPTPDGGVVRFRFVESSVMHPELQAKFPDIRTYIGQGIDNPAATVHFDLTPLGFHAQVFTPTPRGLRGTATDWAGAWYIDPVSRGDTTHYVVYRHGDLPDAGPMICTATHAEAGRAAGRLSPRGPTGEVPLHVLRIAVAASGEYTAYHSAPGPSNQTAGISAVATSINRVNQVFMRDLAVQLVLAANNDAIIYADAATDPFTVPMNPVPPRTSPNRDDIQSQTPGVVNANIAAGAYDLGHGVHALPPDSGFAGRAAIGGVCGAQAASAASTSDTPNGTYFWITVFAHEIGHQLGGSHTFNGIGGSCSNPSEYTPASAIEPGSGVTIMSYAGNCGDDDVLSHNTAPAGGGLPQGAALPMLGAYNIDQINQWLAANFCGFNVQTGNRRPFAPAVGAGNWLIPANTPFRLNVTNAQDPDSGQSTSISWEQYNLGLQRRLGHDTGAGEPLFRTFNPTSDPERILPVLTTVLGSPAVRGENLPIFSRTMQFRAVCRDNFAQGGGVTQSQVTVGVWRTPGDVPFRVTLPAAGTTLCAGQILAVQWDPAGTADAPVNAATVDITLSLDGGQSWPITLLANAANSGQAIVPVPAVNTSLARVKVEATNNIFFNINPGMFTIASGPPSVNVEPADVAICPGQTATLSFTPGFNPAAIQWFKDGSPVTNATSSTLTIAPASNFASGDYHATLTNGCGQVSTRVARLQVGVSVASMVNMPSASVPPCTPITVQAVQPRGVGPLTFRWFRNGVALVDGDGLTGSLTPTLTIAGARFTQEGMYELVATDSCGPRRLEVGELRVAGPYWVQRGVSPAPGGTGQASDGWTMAYDEFRGVTVMYGGTNTSGHAVNSLWEFDGRTWVARYDSSNSLAQPQQPGQTFFDGSVCPSYRTAVYSPDHQAVFVIVSAGWFYPLRVWRWDGVTWTTVGDRAGSGDVATLFRAAYDRDRRVIVIARVSGNGGPAEILEFNPTTGAFVVGPSPPQANGGLLFESRMWYDEVRRAVIMYDPSGSFTPAAMYAYNGQWATLPGEPIPLGRWTPMEYDRIRQHAVGVTGAEIGPSCGQWYTGTFAFPGSVARYNIAAPPATDWDIPLPDGPPRNPSGAGQSPDIAFSARMLAFDRRRDSMFAVGGRGMSNFACGQSTWDMWERRYLDLPKFDTQPPASPMPAGQSLSLTAEVVGAPAMTLRWRRSGVPLTDGPLPGFADTTVAGAATATLTITGSGATQSAVYRLAAGNGCGQVLSNAAVVGTLAPGDFNQDGSVSVQDIFDFLAAYFSGGPSADFNNSGSVTVQDIFDFLAAYFGG